MTALLDALGAEFAARPTYRKYRTGDDGAITVRSLTTEPKEGTAAPLGMIVSAEYLTLSGIVPAPDGRFEIRDIAITNLIVLSSPDGESGTALRLPEVRLTGVTLRAPGTAGAAPSLLARSISAPGAVLSSGGVSLPIGPIRFVHEWDAAAGKGSYDFTVDDIHYPASVIGRSDPSGAVLSLLGGDMVFDLRLKGDLAGEAGTFDAMLGIESFGTFRLNGSFAGSEAGTLGDFMDMPRKRPLALAPLLSPLVLTDLVLRFEDQSGTRRLLAMIASDLQTEPTSLVAEATAALALGLSDVGNPALVEPMVTAAKTFLTDPKSFTIRSAPGKPVPMQTLFSTATNPAAWVTQLPVSVTAND
ncbi:MAG TPA: hypothetical protein VJS40_10710 [Aestuariivirgaceae bacterium]|nr:hypothetical protein [Aestuariivirgaceae bacterium]